VQWVIPAEALTARGIVMSAPRELGRLLADGTLSEVRAEPGCVVTRARAAEDWQRIGSAVRSALTAALLDPGGWHTGDADADPSSADARIASTARRVIDGDVGGCARAHGGDVSLVDVRDGVVAVRLRGACRGCPAAEHTLRQRFEKPLRQQCPDMRRVREVP